MLTIYRNILLFNELFKKLTLPSGPELNTCPAVEIFKSVFLSVLACIMRWPYLNWKYGWWRKSYTLKSAFSIGFDLKISYTRVSNGFKKY